MTPVDRQRIAAAYADLKGVDWPMICEWAILEWGYDEALECLNEAKEKLEDEKSK